MMQQNKYRCLPESIAILVSRVENEYTDRALILQWATS